MDQARGGPQRLGLATMYSAAPHLPSAALTALVDDRQEWEAFSRPADSKETVEAAGIAKSTPRAWESFVAINGMYCAACSLTVEQALLSVPGVESASVNSASQMARVVWLPGRTQPSQWFSAVTRAGYSAVPVADPLQDLARAAASRMMLWRLLVAGFCMMQVMMYAVPAYLAAPGEMTDEMARLLRWASWVLTLPVILFSCKPFFSSAWRDLRAGTVGMDVPVALGILIAFAASSVATFDSASTLFSEVWFDSVTMFVFFLLGGRLLEQRLQSRTAGALEALSRRLPASVERRDAAGSFETVAVRRLLPGDVIRVSPGEAFPADGVILEGLTQVDEALLTGESQALPRQPESLVLAGSHNLTGVVLVQVLHTGKATRYAGIVSLMQEAASGKPRLARLADRVARPFLAAVVLAALAAGAWWWMVDPSRAIGVAVAVLIVTCPCALSLATPAATLAAAGALARRGILVRDLQALESSAAVDTVVFDKTGTLTQDRMSVGAVHTRTGFERTGALQLAAALARHSLHPGSQAISTAMPETPWVATNVEERAGQGVQGLVAGPSACNESHPAALRLGSAAWCNAPASPRPHDVLQVHLADQQGWLATFDLDEVARPDAQPTIAALLKRGLRVQLLSGDQKHAVKRLASRMGIESSWGDRSPQDKLAHVESLQQAGHRVLMVGDGINDAPVLARADVSMSFANAAPVSRARADVVVMGGELGAVATLIHQARLTQRIVRQNLAWAAAYNAVCVPLAIVGWMPPWLAGLGMAASSLGVVLNSSRLSRLHADPAN
ncbi:MAG: cation-translocating P-type ATPase [Bdellovibrionales bacterium]|nr:cation-translocating P-type ATPase [Ramlibacter sp.]